MFMLVLVRLLLRLRLLLLEHCSSAHCFSDSTYYSYGHGYEYDCHSVRRSIVLALVRGLVLVPTRARGLARVE